MPRDVLQRQKTGSFTFLGLEPEIQELVRMAVEARETGHEPAFQFYVGAAVLTDDGGIIKGSNFQTAESSGLCAERSALTQANVIGAKENCIAIAVVAEGGKSATQETYPCPICRGWIWNFAVLSGVRENFLVVVATTNLDKIEVTTIGELYPHPFGPDDVGWAKPDDLVGNG